MENLLSNCKCCPHQCGVNRLEGTLGFCQCDDKIRIGSICVHHGEEPVFGNDGLVNVFFTHCNLRCIYCQNNQISHKENPEIEYLLSLEQVVSEIEARLTSTRTCVGFVSPSHVSPQMILIIKKLKEKHDDLTMVMNSNGYDSLNMLRLLANKVDVFLPDLKYLDNHLAQDYSGIDDYVEVVKKALIEMFEQKGTDLTLNEQGIIKSGMIIRHLVLPGQIKNTQHCLEFIAKELSTECHLSLMAQYTPIKKGAHHSLLGRSISEKEYHQVIEIMDKLNLNNGWIQSFDSVGHYCPDFKKNHPFDNDS